MGTTSLAPWRGRTRADRGALRTFWSDSQVKRAYGSEMDSPHIKYKGSCLILAASRQTCRDAVKIDRQPGVQIEQTGPRDDRVQSWPHPRVGLDSRRGWVPAPSDADPMR